MAAYATVQDVQDRMLRELSEAEQDLCITKLDDAAVIIDASAPDAPADAKKVVSCYMVIRALEAGGDSSVPMGATQGSMAALGYTQSWTFGNTGASAGDLYLTKRDRKLLGLGDRIGSYSPVQELAGGGPI